MMTRMIVYCQLCILLICGNGIRSATASVNREGLLEEHLLPVGMTRAVDGGFEGSGDDDTPIPVLNSNVMERMTLSEDANNVIESEEESRSKETVETVGEGSGLDEATPKTAAILEKDLGNSTSEKVTEEDATEVPTGKTDETTIPLPGTTEKEEEEMTVTTTGKIETTLPDISTTPEMGEGKETVNTEITMVTNTETTTEPMTTTVTVALETTPTVSPVTEVNPEFELITTEIPAMTVTTAAIPETTTTTTPAAVEIQNEPEAVTELIEVKQVKPVLAESPEETTENGTIHENLTAGTDTLLMKIKSRLLDTDETALESSKDPSRLGTYIVVSLILLSFLSLIGFVLMKRRVQKRRKKSNLDPETLDTEKALLSLSEYKDHPDVMDEGKVKNNEITPIVIKSNCQINKFEKNTNFSSPKNLNTKANEKNVEKDNVLKKTSDNLTQVIIEDPTKDMEEEKTPTNAEKLIVRTHLDQDSIPKKPVIVNRTTLGCVPVSQD